MIASPISSAEPRSRRAPHSRAIAVAVALAVALAGTLVLGAALRWLLAGVAPGGVPLAIPGGLGFANLRHAHSHLGYYGVLVPLAWMAWRMRGFESPRGRTAVLYGVATALAVVGFVRSGYGPLAIAASTVVALVWLGAAWRVGRSARGADEPLRLVLPGTVLALACIPVIARSLRSDPALATAAVQSFLALLLFLVIAPSALAARGLRMRGVILAGLTGALAGASLGLWTAWPARVGLALHALWWWQAARAPQLPRHLAAPWAAAALGLVAMASGALPRNHDVAIGAIHFLVLGPLLPALAMDSLLRPVSARAWWAYQGAVVLLTGPLVWRGLAGGAWPALASALGGTLVLAWWLVMLAGQARTTGARDERA